MKRYNAMIGAISLLIAPVLFADTPEQSPVQLDVVAQKVVVTIAPDGARSSSLAPLDTVLPGETVDYTINYSNEGGQPADNVVIDNPVPELLTYLYGSAEGEGSEILFSLDGQTFAAPEELTVTLPSGATRLAEPEEYRVVRWRLLEPIPAGASGYVRYRAVLSP